MDVTLPVVSNEPKKTATLLRGLLTQSGQTVQGTTAWHSIKNDLWPSGILQMDLVRPQRA